MTNEQNWAVETMDGTEVASGMTRAQAEKRAAELSANTGREYFIMQKEREFQLEKIQTGPRLRAELVKRGFDGETYLGTGKRGATALFYRVAATGEFVGVLS